MNISDFLNISPYSLQKNDKKKLLDSYLNSISRFHYNKCLPYKKIIESTGFNIDNKVCYTELPFLPVRLFKMFELKSVQNKDVVKTMTSSGTSGQAVSKIFLDRETSSNQTKVLSKIVSSFTGKKRMPMIIIDSESVVKNRKLFSARGAGILGFSMFGSKRIYALNDKMELKIDSIVEFIEQNKEETIFIFGFTYIIYLHFYKELKKLNIKLDLSNSVMIHGGGWKKLINESISSKIFKEKLKNVCSIESVHDYYGMVEQTGSIFMECEKGYLHSSIFSDIIIRDPKDFSIAKVGEKGIIQVISILPSSYPGHSLLTEDEGILLGEDDCSCGRSGKYFKVVGRLKNAEIRGCSDTYGHGI